MSSTVAIIQARCNSSRLPGKVLLPLASRPVLEWVLTAARAIRGVDRVIVALPDDPREQELLAYCESQGIEHFVGSVDDVLDRYYKCAKHAKADTVIRLTADCPLLDAELCSELLSLYRRSTCNYASNATVPAWPDGLDCEVFSFAALERAHLQAKKKSHREHVTQYILHNRRQFNIRTLGCPSAGLHRERWTLDTPQDYAFLQALTPLLPAGRAPRYFEVLETLDQNPNLRQMNAAQTRNEGLEISKRQESREPSVPFTFKASQQLLDRAEKVIPLGSQTFSKSRTHYPLGHSPFFLTHGLGAKVWDVDGNEFVDLVNALLPNILGYCDPDVDAAIRDQLNQGITFSMATELEIILAEELVKIIPCAEAVRFGKNGSDATSACIRIARAATGRDRVLVSGYHGWQDWYIGSTSRNKGVPSAVQALTTPVAYNDLDAVEDLLKKNPEQFACMILEPMNFVTPSKNYLGDLKTLLHHHGALLVFDEVITGFRFALGGAQEYFGVTPDLASFGKSMGNGMPISAVTGRADLMKEVEEIFFSTTFAGETLSLAAAICTVRKLKSEAIVGQLWSKGQSLRQATDGLIAQFGLADVLSLRGLDPWQLLQISGHRETSAEVIKTFLLQQLLASGVLTGGSHNISAALQPADIAYVVSVYEKVFARLRAELDQGQMASRLVAPVIKPLFKVR